MSVEITISLGHLTPQQVAELFCDFDSGQQAEFFNHITEIARAWPGAGWCKQSCDIVRSRDLSDDGKRAIDSLCDHWATVKAETAE